MNAYHLRGHLLCHDVKVSTTVETTVTLDHFPTMAEAGKLLERSSEIILARNLGEGCPFELSEIQVICGDQSVIDFAIYFRADKMPAESIRRFEFYSGSAFHPSGLGEWIAQVETTGNWIVTHRIDEQVHLRGYFRLDAETDAQLWSQIDQIEFKNTTR